MIWSGFFDQGRVETLLCCRSRRMSSACSCAVWRHQFQNVPWSSFRIIYWLHAWITTVACLQWSHLNIKHTHYNQHLESPLGWWVRIEVRVRYSPWSLTLPLYLSDLTPPSAQSSTNLFVLLVVCSFHGEVDLIWGHINSSHKYTISLHKKY